MDEIVTVREMQPEDEPGVDALFAACEDYFVAATGGLALPADVQSLYYALPDGSDFDQKRLLEEAAVRGMRNVTATCPRGWEPGLGFLRSLGFEIGAPHDATALCTALLRPAR